MAPPPPDAGSFEPGRIFARRFRLVHRLRTTAAADLWRADDLVDETVVALEIVRAADDRQRDALLRTMLRARDVTHPAVCRVFDAGVEDGLVYAVRELIAGETLRVVLRRAGRLPPEKVADIGRQLCIGLAALHAAGIQAPIDPWDVVLDEDGSVRIIDFVSGVIRLQAAGAGQLLAGAGLSDPGGGRTGPAGLPMPARFESDPPEAAQECPADAASAWGQQAHSLGRLLHDLLGGGDRPARTPAVGRDASRSGGSGRTRPTPAPGSKVDPRLERVILQALAADPRRRPTSPAAMAVALTPQGGSAGGGWGAWTGAAAVIAAVAAALAALATLLVPDPPQPLTDRDTIVLADVTNTTGNPVFDGALKVALAVALEQSPFLRIYPDDRARELLRLMQRPSEARITVGLAREIARRERLKALVAASIAPRGGGYVLTLEALEAGTGQTMGREQVEAVSDDDVLNALGTAAARLRGRLGESLASVQRFDVPLPQATTASLDALHAYWLAHDEGRLVPRSEAIPHLQRAIALDPDFAMAHAALSGVYRNTDRSAEAPAFSRRAFDLRDRVSERERFFIAWRFYVDAAQAWDRALELATTWTRTYPREAFAFNSVGLASAAFGHHDEAAAAFREAIRLDPRFVPPYGNLAGSLIASNRFAEAKAQLAEAAERGIAFITLRRMRFLLAFMENDSAGMARELDDVRRSGDASWAFALDARAAAFTQERAAAHDLFRNAVRSAVQHGARELAAQWTMEDAEVHAIAGECDAAAAEVQSGLSLGRDSFTLERAARALALCGDPGARTLAAELEERFAGATLTARIHLPVVEALHALRQGDPQRALRLLEPVAPYDHAPAAEFWPSYLRGQALLALSDGRAAAAQFRAIVDHRGEAPTSPLYPLARGRLAEADARLR